MKRHCNHKKIEGGFTDNFVNSAVSVWQAITCSENIIFQEVCEWQPLFHSEISDHMERRMLGSRLQLMA